MLGAKGEKLSKICFSCAGFERTTTDDLHGGKREWSVGRDRGLVLGLS